MAEESGSSKLESLTKDELIKLVKKYIILQKQLKTKNEDLNKKVSELESNEAYKTQNHTDNKNDEQKILISKELHTKIDGLDKLNDEFKTENVKLKLKIESLNEEVNKLNKSLSEYEAFKNDIQPQLENAKREIESNKSMLDMLNSEIQLLNSEKLQLEKKLLNTRRNTTPSVIVEEDEEDLAEEEQGKSYSLNKDINGSEECEANARQMNNDSDIDYLKRNAHTPEGILILNKQIEDMTFYIDEIKSELEAEREKTSEYLNEINDLRKQLEKIEGQHNSESKELRSENERLNKEAIDALFLVKSHEEKIKELEFSLNETRNNLNKAESESNQMSASIEEKNSDEIVGEENQNENLSKKYVKCLNLLKNELIEKENFEIINMLNEIDNSNESSPIYIDIIENLKNSLKKRDDRLQEEINRVKYTETQLEKVIKEFKNENENLEIRLNDKIHEFNSYKTQNESKLKSLQSELDSEKEKFKSAQTKYEKFDKETSKNKLLDLEMANYERSIKSLNLQIITKDKEINDVKAELNTANQKLNKLKEDYETLEKEKESSEEKCTKLKQLLVKAKKDVSEAKQQEAEHMSNDASMKAQLEKYNLEIEQYKMQAAELSAEHQKLQDKLHSTHEINQRSLEILENKLKLSEDDLKELKSQLTNLQTEYDNYKLKVQHAFKKKKEQDESQQANDNESQKYLAEIDQLKLVIVKLNEKLEENNDKIKLLEKENELIQDEYSRSLERNTKLITELREKENEWKSKNQELMRDNSLKADETIEIIKNLRSQNETQANQFKEKLKQLTSQNCQSIDILQAQLQESKEEIERLNKLIEESKNRSLSPLSINSSQSNMQHNRLHISTNTFSPINKEDDSISRNLILGNLERQLSESSESHSSSTNDLKKANKTLEQLLNEAPKSPGSQTTSLNYNSYSDHDSKIFLTQIEKLKNDLSKSKLQLEHLNELLNESELNNARLTDQINLLKEEIRRLERNQEREKSISNMEYLKNIVLKFLTFTSQQEKSQLLPVLTTMLKLSQDEQNAIMNAKVVQNSENAAGWSTYLPKWSS